MRTRKQIIKEWEVPISYNRDWAEEIERPEDVQRKLILEVLLDIRDELKRKKKTSTVRN